MLLPCALQIAGTAWVWWQPPSWVRCGRGINRCELRARRGRSSRGARCEAVAYMENAKANRSAGRVVPVYAEDGKTEIGAFVILPLQAGESGTDGKTDWGCHGGSMTAPVACMRGVGRQPELVGGRLFGLSGLASAEAESVNGH
jgi:hypothetical protein